jgi:hypothetical protein
MNRTEFMAWAEKMLAERLYVRSVHREGDNNVQNSFREDVHIGIVASGLTTPSESAFENLARDLEELLRPEQN